MTASSGYSLAWMNASLWMKRSESELIRLSGTVTHIASAMLEAS